MRLTSRFFLADNYLLKNGTSDVLLCGNSSDAGYVGRLPERLLALFQLLHLVTPQTATPSMVFIPGQNPGSFHTPPLPQGQICREEQESPKDGLG